MGVGEGVYWSGGPVAFALPSPESQAVTGAQSLHPTRFPVQVVVNLGEESQAHFPEVHRDNVEGRRGLKYTLLP